MRSGSETSLVTRRRAAGLLAAGAVMAAKPGHAQPASPPPVPIAPAVDIVAAKNLEDRMTVPVSINGQGPFAFIVDTGSNRTCISEQVVQNVGLMSAGPLVVQAATAEAVADSVSIDSLKVGMREARNVHAPVFKQADMGADGLLGIDALSNQSIVMDFRAKRMTIAASSSRGEAGEIVVSARSRYGQLILVDSAFDDTSLYVVIDTGGEVSIANSRLRALVTRRRREALAVVGQVISVSGAEANADMDILPRVTLGGVVMTNVLVAYADVHAFEQFGLQNKPAMLLGMDLLRHFDRVAVDFKARRVRFLLPPSLPDAIPIVQD